MSVSRPCRSRLPGERRRNRRPLAPRTDVDRRAESCRLLEALVARAFGVTVPDLRGVTRGHAPVAFARQVAMYVAHVWFRFSLSEVGRRFGRDRTTVAHACRVVEEERDDPHIDRVISAIEASADLWHDFVASLEGQA
ncbi:helix-turn-helix domain-containing protein [Pinisolibacter aquiterrae]|uniref:helix-turn-helix domain-containing protein n=1 Tax=Pinisolibacter aquiterrae TaxID=2815579 RepID=UPI0030840264